MARTTESTRGAAATVDASNQHVWERVEPGHYQATIGRMQISIQRSTNSHGGPGRLWNIYRDVSGELLGTGTSFKNARGITAAWAQTVTPLDNPIEPTEPTPEPEIRCGDCYFANECAVKEYGNPTGCGDYEPADEPTPESEPLTADDLDKRDWQSWPEPTFRADSLTYYRPGYALTIKGERNNGTPYRAEDMIVVGALDGKLYLAKTQKAACAGEHTHYLLCDDSGAMSFYTKADRCTMPIVHSVISGAGAPWRLARNIHGKRGFTSAGYLVPKRPELLKELRKLSIPKTGNFRASKVFGRALVIAGYATAREACGADYWTLTETGRELYGLPNAELPVDAREKDHAPERIGSYGINTRPDTGYESYTPTTLDAGTHAELEIKTPDAPWFWQFNAFRLADGSFCVTHGDLDPDRDETHERIVDADSALDAAIGVAIEYHNLTVLEHDAARDRIADEYTLDDAVDGVLWFVGCALLANRRNHRTNVEIKQAAREHLEGLDREALTVAIHKVLYRVTSRFTASEVADVIAPEPEPEQPATVTATDPGSGNSYTIAADWRVDHIGRMRDSKAYRYFSVWFADLGDAYSYTNSSSLRVVESRDGFGLQPPEYGPAPCALADMLISAVGFDLDKRYKTASAVKAAFKRALLKAGRFTKPAEPVHAVDLVKDEEGNYKGTVDGRPVTISKAYRSGWDLMVKVADKDRRVYVAAGGSPKTLREARDAVDGLAAGRLVLRFYTPDSTFCTAAPADSWRDGLTVEDVEAELAKRADEAERQEKAKAERVATVEAVANADSMVDEYPASAAALLRSVGLDRLAAVLDRLDTPPTGTDDPEPVNAREKETRANPTPGLDARIAEKYGNEGAQRIEQLNRQMGVAPAKPVKATGVQAVYNAEEAAKLGDRETAADELRAVGLGALADLVWAPEFMVSADIPPERLAAFKEQLDKSLATAGPRTPFIVLDELPVRDRCDRCGAATSATDRETGDGLCEVCRDPRTVDEPAPESPQDEPEPETQPETPAETPEPVSVDPLPRIAGVTEPPEIAGTLANLTDNAPATQYDAGDDPWPVVVAAAERLHGLQSGRELIKDGVGFSNADLHLAGWLLGGGDDGSYRAATLAHLVLKYRNTQLSDGEIAAAEAVLARSGRYGTDYSDARSKARNAKAEAEGLEKEREINTVHGKAKGDVIVWTLDKRASELREDLKACFAMRKFDWDTKTWRTAKVTEAELDRFRDAVEARNGELTIEGSFIPWDGLYHVTAERDGDGALVGFEPGAPDFYPLLDAVKAAGARFNGQTKQWALPDATAVRSFLAAAQRVASGSTDLSELEAVAELLLGDLKERAAREAEILAGNLAVPEGRELYPFQSKGVAFLAVRQQALLADDMGLGKTVQAIVAAETAEPGPACFLVVCPASVVHNWCREIERWAPEQPMLVSPLDASRALDVGVFRWSVVSYDTAKRKGELRDRLQAQRWAAVIVDESHKVKNPKSQRHGFVASLDTERLWQLTGTPMTNRPMDLLGLLRAAKQPIASNRHKYGIRYCDAYHNGYGWDYTGSSNLGELSERLSDWMLRRHKDDELDLPGKLRVTGDVETANGYRYRKPKDIGQLMEERHALAIAKVPATIGKVLDSIEENGKAIVFSEYLGALDALCEALRKARVGFVRVDGSVTGETRQQRVDAFQDSSSIKVFVGQTLAAGEGITLTSAAHVFFNDLALVPAYHWQAEDRAYRIGQTSRVVVWYALSDCPLDEKLWLMLSLKQQTVEAFEGGLNEPAAAVSARALLQALDVDGGAA